MTSRSSSQGYPFLFSLALLGGLLAIILLKSNAIAPLLSLPTILNYSNPVVRNGRTGVSYRGASEAGIEQFQNIFYAEDTSGPNRFAPPVPYVPPAGTIVDATKSGAWCPQAVGAAPLPFTSAIDNVSENCLSLRIARTAGTKATAKLPVLVYIHGGGDALGSASDQFYQPNGLVRQAKANGQPVIYVGINYRLGIFGFANSKTIRDTKQGNNGLRDQRAAFEWIRDNIGAFGGDPGNVVAIGHSVGASAIGFHLTSYRGSRGVPFQKAIMMSGATGTNFNIMSSLVADNTATVAKTVGCTQDPDSKAALDCLRNFALPRLMDVSVSLARTARPPFGELAFYPSYDGDYIPDRPSVLLRKGAFVKGIPLIGSWVTNDGAWYAQPDIKDDISVLASFQTFVLGLSPSSLQTLLALYPVSDFAHLVRPSEVATTQHYRAAQLNRDIWFTCPVIDFTWQYTRHSGSTNVRLYEMNQTKFQPIFEYMGVPQWRVSHLSDIPYMLNEDVAAGGDNSAAQRELSALLSASAAAFAYTGNPTSSRGRTLANWPTAYSDRSKVALSKDYPERLDLFLLRGMQGNGPATITADMSSDTGSEREKALAWERVIERCRFINSILEEIGV